MTLKLKEKPVAKETEETEEEVKDFEQEEEQVETKEAEAKEDELAELRESNRKMAERLERLESAPKSSEASISSAQLEAMTDEQKEAIEKTTGMPFSDVLSRVKINEQARWESERIRERARQNVRDAIDDETDRNPKMAKLKSHVKEYLADISDNDKADPVRLARHMKKAIIYAKGAAGVPDIKPSNDRVTRTARPEEGEDPDIVDNDPKNGKIKPGKYRFSDEFSIKLEEMVKPEMRKKITHPEHGTGVRISSDFDEPPRFR